MNSISNIWFANFFSHCVGCLFTLLVVSFAVQKLFSLVYVVPVVYFLFCCLCFRCHIQEIITNTHINEFYTCFLLGVLIIIYLFLAVLGLRFCVRASSSCGKWGLLLIAVCGPLTIAASLVAEHRLQTHRLSSCGSRA